MAEITKELGRIPVSRGDYQATVEYYKDNIVQYKRGSYQVVSESPIIGIPPTNDKNIVNPGWTLFAGTLDAQDVVNQVKDQETKSIKAVAAREAEILAKSDAAEVSFDNTGTSISETNVQDALEKTDNKLSELDVKTNGIEENILLDHVLAGAESGIIPHFGWAISDFIPVNGGDSIYWKWASTGAGSGLLGVYDADYNLIGTFSSYPVTGYRDGITMVTNASYIRASFKMDELNEGLIKANGIEIFKPQNKKNGLTQLLSNIEEEGKRVSKTLGIKNYSVRIENGTTPNPGNANAVQTEPVEVVKGDVVSIEIKRNLPEGHRYAFGNMGYNVIPERFPDNTGYIGYANYPNGVNNFIITSDNCKAFSFNIVEIDANENYIPLRFTDFASGEVIVSVKTEGLVKRVDAIEENLVLMSTTEVETLTNNSSFCKHKFVKGNRYIVDVISGSTSESRVCISSDTNLTKYKDIKYGEEFIADDNYEYVYNIYIQARPFSISVREYENAIRSHEHRLSKIEKDTSYYSNAELVMKIKSLTKDSFALLHSSDMHGSEENVRNIANFMKIYDGVLDDAICTGDILLDSSAQDNVFEKINHAEKIALTIGNHDSAVRLDEPPYYNWLALGAKGTYDKILKKNISSWNVNQPVSASDIGKSYYYKDYQSKGIRLVVLDLNFWNDIEKAWLEETLTGARQAGLHVVIGEHYAFKTIDVDVVDCQFTNITKSIEDDDSSYIGGASNLQTISSIVDEFVSNGGIFVAYLTGHTHFDYIAKVKNKNQYVITIGSSGTSDREMYRGEKTPFFDRFNIVGIDTSSRILKLLRVGANYNKYLQHLDTICFKY